MKRSQSINLAQMRKYTGVFALKPLALCMAVLFSGCGSNEQQADIFKDLDECKSTYPDLSAQCEMAFNEALKKAEDTSPKYKTLDDCVAEFGADRCLPHTSSDGNSWFMPAMAGFMLAQVLDGNQRYNTAPMFTSSNYSSPYYNRWTGVDGSAYGDYRNRQVRTHADAFKPKPRITKTIERGGFGSKSAAASSWGSGKTKSSSRSSWGS
ncbi:MAG: hypothetical protein RL497_1959 [Pseudomonadota bacterium]|jgi:uncharacterized protein YgiB involved in biofilm formation